MVEVVKKVVRGFCYAEWGVKEKANVGVTRLGKI